MLTGSRTKTAVGTAMVGMIAALLLTAGCAQTGRTPKGAGTQPTATVTVTVTASAPAASSSKPSPRMTGSPDATSEATPTGAGPEVTYEGDWSTGMGSWAGSSDWKALNDVLLNDGTNESNDWRTLFAPARLTSSDYAVEAEIRSIRPGNSFGLVVRAADNGSGYAGGVGEYWEGTSGIADMAATGPWGDGGLLAKGRTFDPGTAWHTYRMEAAGNRITLLVDGARLVGVTDNRYLNPGQVGLWSSSYQLEIRAFRVFPGSP